MVYTDNDYQALNELKNSHGWKLLTQELDIRIKAIEEVLFTPKLSDILWTQDPVEQIRLLNHKKEERIYLINLKDMPQDLLNTKIKMPTK